MPRSQALLEDELCPYAAELTECVIARLNRQWLAESELLTPYDLEGRVEFCRGKHLLR